MDTEGSKKFKDAHKTWFIEFYGNGFKQARKSLKEYAIYLSGKDNGDFYDDLSADQIKQINAMAALDVNEATFCPNDFVYPTWSCTTVGNATALTWVRGRKFRCLKKYFYWMIYRTAAIIVSIEFFNKSETMKHWYI